MKIRYAVALLVGASWLAACGKGRHVPNPDDGVSGASGSGLGGSEQGGHAGADNQGLGGVGDAPTTSVEGALPAPVDNRPTRPAWRPSIPLGEPGWRDSVEPLCETHRGGSTGFEVWAGDAGVYAAYGTDCNPFAHGVCRGEKGLSVQFNDGSGWRPLYQTPPQQVQLTGFKEGPAVLTGYVQSSLGVYFLDQAPPALSRELTISTDVINRHSVFTVDATLAYAADNLDLLELDGGAWTKVASLPEDTFDLWADESVVIAAVFNRALMVKARDSDQFEPLPNVPAGHYLSVWGFGPDDIWAGGGQNEIIHYDGEEWTTFETGSQDTSGSGIVDLWGSDGVVYFLTHTEFGRISAESGAEILIGHDSAAESEDEQAPNAVPRLIPMGLWGTSANEVFVTLNQSGLEDYACGGSFIVWFDGSEFHQF